MITAKSSVLDVRWTFTDITTAACRWVGEISTDAGKSWRKQAEFFARRASR